MKRNRISIIMFKCFCGKKWGRMSDTVEDNKDICPNCFMVTEGKKLK